MCGIAGFVDRSLAADAARATLVSMAQAIRHRGPDQDGTWLDESTGVGLAHRRLSILDLTEAGRQPMTSAGGRFVVVFNGEIYNHGDLRRDLLAADPTLRFRGHSDTEEMLAAFEAWGVRATVERLNGMFAFALYDRQDRRLYLCRDRLGEKPLYFGRAGTALLFGSELKALRRHPRWRGGIDLAAAQDYFRYGYVTGGRSIHEGIGKVLPGQLVSIALGDGEPQVTSQAYWSARETVRRGLEAPVDWSDREAIERLENLLEEAVAMRMEADVPLGAFLSGGVDSTVVVALMQRRASAPVKTFSIGFGEARFNEAEAAKAVASHLRTEHTELYVTPREALDVIPRLAAMYDEPFADASQIPTFLVAQLARRHVTVALSGDGGDELFGGYDRYDIAERFWRTAGPLPRPLRLLAARAIESIPLGAWDVLGAWLPARLSMGRPGDRIHKLGQRLRLARFDELYSSLLSLAVGDRIQVTRGDGLASSYPPDSVEGVTGLAERMMAWDLAGYLPDDILVKVDRATMAVSLEGRIPLLDHRVAEFAWGLPMNLKRRDGQGKWILKQVLHRLVPRELVDRPKQGFGVPIEYWLRHELRDWATDLLSPSRLRAHGLLDVEVVQGLLQEHLDGRRSWAAQLWTLLMFQAWMAEQDGA
jgi:asparagine synthase (glutamine-hydrolysing)